MTSKIGTNQTMRNEYELLDSGDGRKLELFGDVVLSRPCDQALWEKQKPEMWARAVASFDRASGWQADGSAELPSSWVVTINDIAMRLKLTPAGHLGVFPETRLLWDRIGDTVKSFTVGRPNVLNLFAYTGGATLAAARAGCSVCHVDASKSMVTRARENAGLNQLEAAPIRWIVEDVGKFLGSRDLAVVARTTRSCSTHPRSDTARRASSTESIGISPQRWDNARRY